MRPVGTILTESLIVGVGAIAVGSGLAYVIVGKNFFKEHPVKSISIFFLTGALVHIGSELVGGNKVFCENFTKQSNKK